MSNKNIVQEYILNHNYSITGKTIEDNKDYLVIDGELSGAGEKGVFEVFKSNIIAIKYRKDDPRNITAR